MRLVVHLAVSSQLGQAGKALPTDLAPVPELVGLAVGLEVVNGGERLAAELQRAGIGPDVPVGLQVPLQLVGGGEGPDAALHAAAEGPLLLRGVLGE